MNEQTYQKGDWVISLIDSFAFQTIDKVGSPTSILIYSPEMDFYFWRRTSDVRPFIEGDPSPYDTETILGVPYGDGYNAGIEAYKRAEIARIFDGWTQDPCYDFEALPELAWCLPQLVEMREAYYADIRAEEQRNFDAWYKSKGLGPHPQTANSYWRMLEVIYQQQQQLERLQKRIMHLEMG